MELEWHGHVPHVRSNIAERYSDTWKINIDRNDGNGTKILIFRWKYAVQSFMHDNVHIAFQWKYFLL